VPPLGFADHVRQVEHLLLERRRRRQELEQVVPALGRHLGVRTRREVGERDVVHGHRDAVALSPLARVAVEPRVVGRHEVTPLHDAQRLLGALRHHVRRHRQRRGGLREPPQELPPADRVLDCHAVSPFS